jgi:hypothetical protein
MQQSSVHFLISPYHTIPNMYIHKPNNYLNFMIQLYEYNSIILYLLWKNIIPVTWWPDMNNFSCHLKSNCYSDIWEYENNIIFDQEIFFAFFLLLKNIFKMMKLYFSHTQHWKFLMNRKHHWNVLHLPKMWIRLLKLTTNIHIYTHTYTIFNSATQYTMTW